MASSTGESLRVRTSSAVCAMVEKWSSSVMASLVVY
jgi:hypothetical protein